MITKQIASRTQSFFFGTYTMKLIRELTGVEYIDDVFHGLANFKPGVGELRCELDQLDFICKFLFACAKHANALENKPVDFNEAIVAGWLDELGLDESSKLLTGLIASYKSKNLSAPATGHTSPQE